MNVEIALRINGQAVATLKDTIFGEAIEIEQQSERLKDKVGQVVLEAGFAELSVSLRRPYCCGMPMENKGVRPIMTMSLSGEVIFERTRYRCRIFRIKTHRSQVADLPDGSQSTDSMRPQFPEPAHLHFLTGFDRFLLQDVRHHHVSASICRHQQDWCD